MALKRNREEEEIVESLAMNNFTRSIIVDKRAAAPARAFKCKTCDRQFDTFQALGGHTAGHSTKSGELPKSQKAHPCSICGDVFPTGQALGGHMRKHRAVADPAVSDELASSDLTIGADVAETKEGIKTKRSLDLDLNLLPDKEEDYNERANNNSKLGSDDLQIVKEDNSKPDLQQNSLHYDDLTLKDTGFIRLKERDIKLEYYEFL